MNNVFHTSSRPPFGQEGELNSVQLFNLRMRWLKYLYQKHVGLNYEME